MEIKSLLTIKPKNEDERKEIAKAKDILNQIADLIETDTESRAVFSRNQLRSAADILNLILEGKELY